MHTAFFVVTNRCTRSCPFCFYATGYLRHPPSEMPPADLFRAAERLARMGVRQLIITGGEPLIRGETMELIGRAGNLGMERLLLTSGDLLDMAAARRLIEARIEGVSFSLNSLDDARRNEGAVEHLRRAASTALTAVIVFSTRNLQEVAALHAWARARGMGVILQPAFIPEAAGDGAELSPRRFTRAEWEAAAATLRQWGREQGAARYVEYVLAIYGGGVARPARCLMGGRALVLDCDGRIYPCFHRRDMTAGGIFADEPATIMRRLARFASALAAAPCYGEHCVSLFCGEAE